MNSETFDDEPEPPTGWQWLGGCCIGALLGAIGAPLAFLGLLGVLAYFDSGGDSSAEGVPFFLLVSIPLGAIVGAICFPVARLIFVLLRAKIRRRKGRK